MDTQHRRHALTLRRECVEPLLALPIAPLLLALLLDQTVQLLLEQSLTLRLLRESSALCCVVLLGVRLESIRPLCPPARLLPEHLDRSHTNLDAGRRLTGTVLRRRQTRTQLTVTSLLQGGGVKDVS